MDNELCFRTATELAALIRTRKLSPQELVQAYLDRIERLNPHLNAYVTVCTEHALAEAHAAEQALMTGKPLGALHGVPFAVKDLLFTNGVRTTGGSRCYADYLPTQDAIAVERLRAAGAILLGKTNTPEFGFKSSTENILFGTTNNPWDAQRTAGGSSGGSGAATAAGLAPLSLGTDGGGSIRTPASFCGIVGLKPSFGRVPGGPGFGGGATIAHTGPMTRTVADAALMLGVIAGPDARAPRTLPASATDFGAPLRSAPATTRIGWSLDLGYAALDSEVEQLVVAALTDLDAAGWSLTPDALKIDNPEAAFNTIIRAENYIFARPLADQHPELLEPEMLEFTRNGASLSAHDYLAANVERDRLSVQLEEFFTRHDMLITPSLAVPAFLHGQRPRTIAGRAVSGMDWLSFTYPFNLTGHPAASIPCGWTAGGLPVGLQVVGPRFADLAVLEVCAAIEALRPWATRRPPLQQ